MCNGEEKERRRRCNYAETFVGAVQICTRRPHLVFPHLLRNLIGKLEHTQKFAPFSSRLLRLNEERRTFNCFQRHSATNKEYRNIANFCPISIPPFSQLGTHCWARFCGCCTATGPAILASFSVDNNAHVSRVFATFFRSQVAAWFRVCRMKHPENCVTFFRITLYVSLIRHLNVRSFKHLNVCFLYTVYLDCTIVVHIINCGFEFEFRARTKLGQGPILPSKEPPLHFPTHLLMHEPSSPLPLFSL